jgi:hypothetical protein
MRLLVHEVAARQLPWRQDCPEAQTLPQPPQLLGSVWVSMQDCPQLVSPD